MFFEFPDKDPKYGRAIRSLRSVITIEINKARDTGASLKHAVHVQG